MQGTAEQFPADTHFLMGFWGRGREIYGLTRAHILQSKEDARIKERSGFKQTRSFGLLEQLFKFLPSLTVLLLGLNRLLGPDGSLPSYLFTMNGLIQTEEPPTGTNGQFPIGLLLPCSSQFHGSLKRNHSITGLAEVPNRDFTGWRIGFGPCSHGSNNEKWNGYQAITTYLGHLVTNHHRKRCIPVKFRMAYLGGRKWPLPFRLLHSPAYRPETILPPILQEWNITMTKVSKTNPEERAYRVPSLEVPQIRIGNIRVPLLETGLGDSHVNLTSGTKAGNHHS